MPNQTNISRIEKNLELFNELFTEMNLDEDDIETVNVENVIKSIDSLKNQLYFIMNLTDYKYEYFNQEACDLLGITFEEIQKMGSEAFFYTFVHPDDIMYCYKMFEGFAFFLKKEDINIQNLRIIFSYRIKIKTGEYKRVIETSNIVGKSDNKNVLINFGQVSFIPIIPKSIITSGAVIDITTGEKLFVLTPSIKEVTSHNLTKRERQIVGLIAVGLKTKEISERLFISKSTIETHRKNIIKKLKVKNSVELVWKAIELSLIPD